MLTSQQQLSLIKHEEKSIWDETWSLWHFFKFQDSSNDNAPEKQEEVNDASPDEDNNGVQEDAQPAGEEQLQQEVTIDEEETHQEASEQQEHQIPQVPEVEQDQEVPVHQGQPEI